MKNRQIILKKEKYKEREKKKQIERDVEREKKENPHKFENFYNPLPIYPYFLENLLRDIAYRQILKKYILLLKQLKLEFVDGVPP